MAATLSRSPKPATPHALPLLVALTAAGFAGNAFGYQVFFSIEFLFGSIFSMLALQALGLGPGVIAAVVASSVTYHFWNHPYAIVIMTCEVLVVGILSRRKGIELVLADAIYWVVLGMPLVYVFYASVMGLPPSNATITMFKQALNGISNALAARLLFMVAPERFRTSLPSLREFVFNLLALFVLAPSLLLLALESKAEFAQTDRTVRESLRMAAVRVSTDVAGWLHERSNEVVRLAGIAGTRGVAEVQQSLEDTMSAGGDFLRMGFMDRGATVVASAPLVDELGHPNLGKSLAGRPHIQVLKETRRPMFSEVMVSRIGVPTPIVTALAPVESRGQYAGYVSGVLSLAGLDEAVSLNARSQSLPGLLYALVDQNGRLIVTNRADARIMEALNRGAGELRDLGGGVSEWVPPSRKNTSISERWKNAVYTTENRIGPLSEWTLVLDQPVAPFQAALYASYAKKMAVVLAILAAALPLAAMLSRRVGKSLRRLEAATADIPGRIDSGQEMQWPHSNLSETEQLIENFKGVTGALAERFDQLRHLNLELRHALDEVKTLRGIVPICSSCKRIRNDSGRWEPMENYVTHHSEAKFSHGLCPDCLATNYPEYASGPDDEKA
jgi:two-component system, cell cycle sensor histidine kinase and response regulator CckA